MQFHGFHMDGGRHLLTITDEGKRQVIEVTARERRAIGKNRARAYRTGFQFGRSGSYSYSPPMRCGIRAEEWTRGYEKGLAERRRRL